MEVAGSSSSINVPNDYVFTAVLTRNEENNPVIIDGSYVFCVVEDSTNLFIPIESIDINNKECLMCSFIPTGYTKEFNLKLALDLAQIQEPVQDDGLIVNEDEPRIEGNDDAQTYWGEAATKLLISLYPTYRQRVTDRKIRSQEKMWKPLAEELNKSNYFYTGDQCKNKWKALERGYKKKVDNNNKSGRGRKNCSYDTELNEVFAKRSNVFPEVVMGTGAPRTKELLMKQCLSERTIDAVEPSQSASCSVSTPAKNPKEAVKPIRERHRNVAYELKQFRKEVAERQEARDVAIQIREERKIAALEERNILLKRTNQLLEQLLKANVKVDSLPPIQLL